MISQSDYYAILKASKRGMSLPEKKLLDDLDYCLGILKHTTSLRREDRDKICFIANCCFLLDMEK